jgi:hypothetical protein
VAPPKLEEMNENYLTFQRRMGKKKNTNQKGRWHYTKPKPGEGEGAGSGGLLESIANTLSSFMPSRNRYLLNVSPLEP